MRHTLRITLGKEQANSGVVACRHITVRERLLHFLLGTPVRLTVLVPGSSVDEVSIREIGTEAANEVV